MIMMMTPCNAHWKGQLERMNGTVWEGTTFVVSQRERILLDALHSVRSLLCTAINATSHERLFSYTRKSTSQISLPTWLTTLRPELPRRSARSSKYDPFVDEVELINYNSRYAHVCSQDRSKDTVSLRNLTRFGHHKHAYPENTLATDAYTSTCTEDSQEFIHSVVQ